MNQLDLTEIYEISAASNVDQIAGDEIIDLPTPVTTFLLSVFILRLRLSAFSRVLERGPSLSA